MSIKLMTAVWEDEGLNQAETLAMLALSDWADDDGRCWPSLPQLSKKTRLSVRGLREIIIRLIDKGVLEKTEIVGKGTKYVVKPRHYVPPRHNVPPRQMDVETPARRSPNTSVTVKTSGAKAPSVSRETPPPVGDSFQIDCIAWALDKMGWGSRAADEEFNRFYDHALARGAKYIDWMAAWRNWCRSPFCKTKSADDRVAYRKEPLRV